ncbi:hypothetical protein [Streptomyces roseolus]|uniref:hypothetical protein n=1 Tax=Streptomyces roseolus TaxID=67358 RepID=UPI0016769A01|nr:hypothetical protein [Streptomyces roseolus]
MSSDFHLVPRPEADALPGRSPLAVLVGRPLDQQVPGEGAVRRPAGSGTEPFARLRALPGSGKGRARTLLALPGERCDVRPTGRREAVDKAAKASKGSDDAKSGKSPGNREFQMSILFKPR